MKISNVPESSYVISNQSFPIFDLIESSGLNENTIFPTFNLINCSNSGSLRKISVKLIKSIIFKSYSYPFGQKRALDIN